jgi:hypothetical protein
MEKTQFDAVAMTRRIRDEHYERLKDAPPDERIAFYREKARVLHERIAAQTSPNEAPAARVSE